MLKFSFFDSIIGADGQPDRAFGAGDFSKYFGTLIKNGIFPNPSSNFQIMGDQNNMTVKSEAGLAWIEGHLGYDDSVYILNIDKADSTMDRIDRIVLRLDTLERCIKWVVKKGEFSVSPIPKPLQRDADGYEIAIADVRVGKGVSKITQSAITDLRMNTELCGWVTGTVTQIDTSTLFNQLEQWKTEYIEATNTWTTEQEQAFLNWKQLFETAATDWRAGEEQKFDEWLQSIKGKLSGDVAGNLQNQIEELKEKDITTDGEIAKIKSNITTVSNRVTKIEESRTQVELTIERAKWSGNKYSLEAKYPFAQYDIYIIDFADTVTKEQIYAWGDGMIRGSMTENVLTALDIVPKIDVPVKLELVKKGA